MKWLYGLLCLFFLIIFHEFGHFLAAKLFKVKVESFSVGFGPVLLHKKIRGTDYRLSLIPLGGYCGMKGEKDFKSAIEENLSEIHAEKDSLYGVHPLKRALIGFAGPFANFIFAFLAYSIIALTGYKYYTYSNKIILASELYENASMVAENAGLKSGDEIVKINKKNISDFSEIINEVATRPEEEIEVTVLRDKTYLSFKMTPELDKSSGSGKIGVAADSNSLIEKEAIRYGFFSSMGHGFLECIQTISLTFKSIGVLFKGINLDNAVSGPVRVTEMLGSTVKEGFSEGFRQGFVSVLSLMGIISISLFIMNLLPIPVLDGGLILIALIEWLFRKKIKPKIQYYIQFIGIAFIIILMFIGLKGDILYLIHGGK